MLIAVELVSVMFGVFTFALALVSGFVNTFVNNDVLYHPTLVLVIISISCFVVFGITALINEYKFRKKDKE